MHTQKGFTFIEILLTVGITFILVVAATPLYGNLQASVQLNESSALIVQTIRTARERSIARLNNASHGVCFEQSRFIAYQGSSCALRDQAYDVITNLESALSLSTRLLDNDVFFSKGIGAPNTTGAITVTHSATGGRVIQINAFGMVELQ